MKKLIALFCVCLQLTAGFAENKTANSWQDGAAAYQRKDYNTAAQIYEDLLRKDPNMAEACYNLGNTYYRMNRISEAVLQYQRALFLRPDMKTAEDNSRLAQQRIPNATRVLPDIFFVRWWTQLSSGAHANFWAATALLVFLGFLTLIGFSKARPGRIPPQAIALIALLWCCLLLPAYFSAEHAKSTDRAVVMGNNAQLSASPGQTKGRTPVPEATVVRAGERKGDWICVTLPDNRSGWMPVSELGFVQPQK